ncbi:hypothetical protein [Flavobacterium collinsii]|nr:hypothetical protein [Flavobacterium collinsii]
MIHDRSRFKIFFEIGSISFGQSAKASIDIFLINESVPIERTFDAVVA